VPPHGELITGFSAGPAGTCIDIVAAFEGGAPKPSSIVNVAGRPVRVELTYLGSLPA
jgi:hypothetical protein